MVSHIRGVKIYLDKKVLGEILKVPTERISSLGNEVYLKKSLTIAGKLGEDKSTRILNKQITSDYQLVFEFKNKLMLPEAEKRNETSKVSLFLMEVVFSFQKINLFVIMLKHKDKVVNKKYGKHGLPYGFLLNKVFDFFGVPLG